MRLLLLGPSFLQPVMMLCLASINLPLLYSTAAVRCLAGLLDAGIGRVLHAEGSEVGFSR